MNLVDCPVSKKKVKKVNKKLNSLFFQAQYKVMIDIWYGVLIVSFIVLTLCISLIVLYGLDTFDFANETYNDRIVTGLCVLAAISSAGLIYASQQSHVKPVQKPEPVKNPVEMPKSEPEQKPTPNYVALSVSSSNNPSNNS